MKTIVKATDLRIGNHLKCYNVLIEVTDIVNGHVYSKGHEGEFAIKDLEPIPLTWEVLEQCGFQSYHTNPRLESFFVNITTYYPFHIYENRDSHFYYNENLEVKYLHQLQNLFAALSGEELEVRLENIHNLFP